MCGDVQSEEPVKLRQKEAELIDVIDVACGRLSYAASKLIVARDYRLFTPVVSKFKSSLQAQLR